VEPLAPHWPIQLLHSPLLQLPCLDGSQYVTSEEIEGYSMHLPARVDLDLRMGDVGEVEGRFEVARSGAVGLGVEEAFATK
jgi:hypothetical protein